MFIFFANNSKFIESEYLDRIKRVKQRIRILLKLNQTDSSVYEWKKNRMKRVYDYFRKLLIILLMFIYFNNSSVIEIPNFF